jgi:hypothetical protein
MWEEVDKILICQEIQISIPEGFTTRSRLPMGVWRCSCVGVALVANSVDIIEITE